MRTIKLNILRKKSLVGAVMRYRVFVNNTEIAKLINGESITYDVTADKINLKISLEGNALTLHGFNEEIVLYPEKCKEGVINCEIETSANTFGILTKGWFAPVGKVKIYTEYF